MTAVIRPLTTGTQAATAAILTRPFQLVAVEFPAPIGVVRYSTGPAVTFEGNLYAPDRGAVGQFSWDGDAGQTGQIELFNDDNFASDLILRYGISEVPVLVYDSYHLLDGSVTPPVLMVRGTITDSDLSPVSAILTVSATAEAAERIPNRYVTKREGFNWLPAPGSVITWGTETYIFEES